MSTEQDYEIARLQKIAAASMDTNEVRFECVYGPHVVRFAISAMEVQHLSSDVLYARYFSEAFTALHVPAPVVADTTDERPVVVVGNP